jgi:hypothetical protein
MRIWGKINYEEGTGMRILFALVLLLFLAGAAATGAERELERAHHFARHATQVEEKELIEIEVPFPEKKQKMPRKGGFIKHYEDSLLEVAEDGLYSVEMVVPAGGLKVGLNEVLIVIHDKSDMDVTGAEITVTPWMPDMGHGVTVEAVVKEKGGGLYSVEDVGVSMSGRWELRVKVVKDGIEDRAVFNFPDVKGE